MWYAKPSGPYDKYSTEGTANILEMRDFLRNNYSYTDEAVTGVVSNSIYEGGLNPWRWGGDQYPPPAWLNGCGLFGFTPYTLYLTLQGSEQMNLSTTTITQDASPNVGAQQMQIMADGTWGWHSSCWREYNPDRNTGWDPTLYPEQYAFHYQLLNTYGNGVTLTQAQYATINDIPSAVFAFLACFEGPAIPNYTARLSVANEVYEIITGHPPQPPTPTRRKSMPVYMMIKRFI